MQTLQSTSSSGEGFPQVIALAGEELQRNRRLVRNLVERVKGARSDLLVHGDTCLAEALPVLQALLIEEVQRPDADPCRREPRQILPTRRRGLFGIGSVHVPTPRQLVVGFGPHDAPV